VRVESKNFVEKLNYFKMEELTFAGFGQDQSVSSTMRTSPDETLLACPELEKKRRHLAQAYAFSAGIGCEASSHYGAGNHRNLPVEQPAPSNLQPSRPAGFLSKVMVAWYKFEELLTGVSRKI